jgi:ubiquitin-protein ligase E3 C
VSATHLAYLTFLGRMLGKAMYEGILVELPFAAFFLSKLRGRPNELNDLSSLDPELYKNLLFLKRYQGDVKDLALYFVARDDHFGEKRQVRGGG